MKPDQIAASEHVRPVTPQSVIGPAFGPILVGITVLLGSFSNFLAYHKYPFLTYEVGIIAASLIAVAAIAGILYRGQRAWGRILMEVLLATIAVDLNTDGFILPVLAAVATLLANLVLKKPVLPLLGITGSIVLITSLCGLTDHREWMSEKLGAQSTPASNAPAVLHIILDEHIGVEGLRSDNPASPAMKAFLKEFYISHGFRLFGRAHSEYLQTVNSVPQILNYGGRSNGAASLSGGSAGKNKYFDQLRREGYNLHIIQSEWFEMCSAASFRSCKTYWSPSLQVIATSSMNTGDRRRIILFKFLSLSDIALEFDKIYDRRVHKYFKRGINIPEFELKRHARSSTVTALAAFDELIEDVKFASPGDAYIAHILLPHFPYATNSECELLPLPWETKRPRSSLAARERASFEQIKCATAKVDEAIKAIAASTAGRNYIVIVHSDHGSRITKLDTNIEALGQFNDDDMLVSFSTLFAIKMPGLDAGYDDRAVTAASLLQWAMKSRQRPSDFSDIPLSDGAIVLTDREWHPRQSTKLPRSWIQPQTAPN